MMQRVCIHDSEKTIDYPPKLANKWARGIQTIFCIWRDFERTRYSDLNGYTKAEPNA